MDIVSHAFAGAAAGYAFGHPVVGALVGVAPDLVLGVKRRAEPNTLYRFTHSLVFVLLAACAAGFVSLTLAAAVALAACSHLVLDVPTHGRLWSPRLLFPFSNASRTAGVEWEWFNRAWWLGMLITIFWIGICLTLSTVIS
jgi:biotin transporter BioY